MIIMATLSSLREGRSVSCCAARQYIHWVQGERLVICVSPNRSGVFCSEFIVLSKAYAKVIIIHSCFSCL